MVASGEGLIDIYVVVFSAVGVTNQRETTLVWDKETGEPLYNAVGTCIIHLIEQVSMPNISDLINVLYYFMNPLKYFTRLKDMGIDFKLA